MQYGRLMTWAALAAVATPASLAMAGDYLTVGDKAPDIDIEHWVKGVEMDQRGAFEPVTTMGDGKIHVMEFWATWCGPCVAAMPHMSELQDKYRDYDVTFIGVSDETLPKVVEFLFKEYRDGKIHNDRATYALTTDPDGSVWNDYFRAGGHTGIPTAFIIGREGHIEWIGHPMTMDDALDAIARDDWDRTAFKAEYEEKMKPRWKSMEASRVMDKAMEAGDWERVEALMDKAIAADPDNPSIKMQKFVTLMLQMDQPKRAYVYANDTLIKEHWDDGEFLNGLAWFIVDNPKIKTRDLDLAMKIANRSNKLTEGTNAAVLDTVARVHFEKGDIAKAIEVQTKAVKAAEGTPMEADLKKVLTEYESER